MSSNKIDLYMFQCWKETGLVLEFKFISELQLHVLKWHLNNEYKVIRSVEITLLLTCFYAVSVGNKPCNSSTCTYEHEESGAMLASFPGLHAQLLSLAVRKAGEGLDGFIT